MEPFKAQSPNGDTATEGKVMDEIDVSKTRRRIEDYLRKHPKAVIEIAKQLGIELASTEISPLEIVLAHTLYTLEEVLRLVKPCFDSLDADRRKLLSSLQDSYYSKIRKIAHNILPPRFTGFYVMAEGYSAPLARCFLTQEAAGKYKNSYRYSRTYVETIRISAYGMYDFTQRPALDMSLEPSEQKELKQINGILSLETLRVRQTLT